MARWQAGDLTRLTRRRDARPNDCVWKQDGGGTKGKRRLHAARSGDHQIFSDRNATREHGRVAGDLRFYGGCGREQAAGRVSCKGKRRDSEKWGAFVSFGRFFELFRPLTCPSVQCKI